MHSTSAVVRPMEPNVLCPQFSLTQPYHRHVAESSVASRDNLPVCSCVELHG